MPTGKLPSRVALALAIAMAAALIAAPTRAQAGWCASASGPDGGFVNCGYASWQQCRAALSGQGGICHADPRR
ncbi:MAG TPA: DUF3551 domain-containing protein [Xanthobacteraceae bacterium]|nr:DUF3551 domain-containing protein [Xanthobacteraceae bacterium]